MENNNAKKEVTLEAIAELIKTSADENRKVLEDKIESSIDGLAIITNNNFSKLEADIKEVKIDISDMKTDISGLKIDVTNLKYDMKEVRGDMHEMLEKQDKTMTLLDGYVKSTEDAKQENQIVKNEVRQMKDVINQKLGVEIRATV